ncbi:hypothetical protein [Geoglobus ahangari]
MYISVECAACGEVNVANVAYLTKESEFTVSEVQRFDEFYHRYRELVLNLPEFPIKKDHLIRIIKMALNCSTALAHDVLERMKIDIGLYERDGMIYEA